MSPELYIVINAICLVVLWIAVVGLISLWQNKVDERRRRLEARRRIARLGRILELEARAKEANGENLEIPAYVRRKRGMKP